LPALPRRSVLLWGGLIVIVTAIVGAGVFLLLPSQYTAEARVVVGSQSIQAQAVPGYATATGQLATTYTRFFTPTSHGGVSLSLSPIPQSSVIRVEATSDSTVASVHAAADEASHMIQTVNTTLIGKATADDLLAQYEVAQANVLAAQASPTPGEQSQAHLEGLELTADALGKAYQAQVQNSVTGSSTLTLVQPAVATGNNTVSRIEIGVVAAIVAGLLVLAIPLRRRRVDRRGSAS
jgi:hypothetical protein